MENATPELFANCSKANAIVPECSKTGLCITVAVKVLWMLSRGKT